LKCPHNVQINELEMLLQRKCPKW